MGHFTFGDDLRVTVDEAIALVTAYPAAVVERYDFGTVSGPSAITTLEIGLLVGAKMVGLTMAEARHLIDIAPTAPWHRVPIDARLEDAPPNSQLYFGACQLYEHFKAPGISDAKISKLLHLKRRSLVPILDSVVKNLYKDAACERAAANPELGLQRLYWEAIRADVSRAEDIEAAVELRDGLRAMGKREQLLATLTTLRLRDMIIIMEERGSKTAAENELLA